MAADVERWFAEKRTQRRNGKGRMGWGYERVAGQPRRGFATVHEVTDWLRGRGLIKEVEHAEGPFLEGWGGVEGYYAKRSEAMSADAIEQAVRNSPFNRLGREIHAWARGKGFYEREILLVDHAIVVNPSMPAEKLALIHEEVSETLKTLRDGDREAEETEVADILIRVLDYASWRGLDLDAAVEKKMAKNRTRPHLHGRKF